MNLPQSTTCDFIKNKAKAILERNDGGIKMSIMIAELTNSFYENGYPIPEKFLELMMECIEELPGVKVLVYHPTTSIDSRGKQFVYFE